ncbi:hypothetical protein N7G274_007369 [Stereocaulon virgatum]|uniref:Uncharacterized protein n=1 Tax=Stereocaulon virgatum TaxID=373712 RepID=A0ABR4A4W4_9LECA
MASVTPLESFTHLTDNLPSWLTKIDELTVQVAEQNARFIRASQFSDHIIQRKHNSTESLRPNDNDNGVPDPPTDLAVVDIPADTYNPPNPSYKCISGVSRPKIAGTANAHLIQELKRKRKPGSDAHSAASGRPRYRTKSMVVVYYDGAIQDAFENIVRSVAGARNNLRKGKVTANFKARMASMGLEDNPFSVGGEFAMLNPKMMRGGFTRTRMSPDIDGSKGAKLGGFDDADRDLEAVQNLCEVGAHQFLREGDCRLEIEGMRKNLQHVLEIATKEVERLTLEEEKEKEAKRQETKDENKEEIAVEQAKEGTPMVHIDEKKLEPSIEMSPPVKEINFTGTGTIEVDDGSDAESVHIDLSAFRRTRRL